MTHVKLMGEIGEKFGTDWSMKASTFRDVFRLIECQTEGFKQYLVECSEKGVGFTIQNGEDLVDDLADAMIAPVKDTVIITPIAAGSGESDVIKAIFGVLFLIYGPTMSEGLFGGAEAEATAELEAATAAAGDAGMSTVGGPVPTGREIEAARDLNRIQNAKAVTTKIIQGIGTSLAMQGIAGMMTPDQNTPGQSYLFDGPVNNVKEGVGVPLLYGRLIVGGSVINAGFEEIAIGNYSQGGYTKVTSGDNTYYNTPRESGRSGGSSTGGSDYGVQKQK